MYLKTPLKLALPILATLLIHPAQATVYQYTMSGDFFFADLELEYSDKFESHENPSYLGAAPEAFFGQNEFQLAFSLDDSALPSNAAGTQFANAISNFELSFYSIDGDPYTVTINSLTAWQFDNTTNDRWRFGIDESDVAGQIGTVMLDDFAVPPLSFEQAWLDLQDLDNTLIPAGQTGNLVAFDDQFSQSVDRTSFIMDWGYAIPLFGPPPPGLVLSAYLRVSGSIDKNSIQRTAVVPLPAAFWLFGTGILGLAGVSLRKKG